MVLTKQTYNTQDKHKKDKYKKPQKPNLIKPNLPCLVASYEIKLHEQ